MEDWTPPKKDEEAPWTPPVKDTLSEPDPINRTDIIDTTAAGVEAVTHAPVIKQALDIASRPMRASATLINTQPTPFWWPKNTKPGADDSRTSPVLDTLAQVAIANPIGGPINAGLNMVRNVFQGHLPFGGAGKAVFPDVGAAIGNMKDLASNATPAERQAFEDQTASPYKQFGVIPREIGRVLATDVGKDPEQSLPNEVAVRPHFINPDGSINVQEMVRHGLDFGMREGARAATDPVLAIQPGLTPEARAAQSARATAVLERGLGLEGPISAEASGMGAKTLAEANYARTTGEALPAPFKTAAEEAAWTAPSRSDLIAHGDVQISGVSVPRSLWPIAKPLDWIESGLASLRGLSPIEPNIRRANQLLSKTLFDRNAAIYKREFAEQVVPAYRKAQETGLTETDIHRFSDMAETLDPFGNLRAGPELAEEASKRGFKVQSDLPPEVSPWNAEPPVGASKAETTALHEAERIKGMAPFQKKIAENLEAFSGYTPEQFAAGYDLMKKGNEFARRAQSLYAELTGTQLTPLNKAILERPVLMTRALERINKRMESAQYYTKDLSIAPEPTKTFREWHGNVEVPFVKREAGEMATSPEFFGEGAVGGAPTARRSIREIDADIAKAMRTGNEGDLVALTQERDLALQSPEIPNSPQPSGDVRMRTQSGEGFRDVVVPPTKQLLPEKQRFEPFISHNDIPTARFRELKGQLDTPALKNILSELEESKPISPGDLQNIKMDILKQRAEAIRQYNAVSAYRPGRLTGEAKTAQPIIDLPLLRRIKSGGIERAERSFSYNKESGLEGVKTPVYMTENLIKQGIGTRTTEGKRLLPQARDVLESLDQFANKYLVPKGLKDLTADIQRTGNTLDFFEPNSYKAWEKSAAYDYPRSATNRMMDRGALNLYDATPQKAWLNVQDAADTDKIVAGSIGENHSHIYGAMTDAEKRTIIDDAQSGYVDEAGKWYNREEAIVAVRASKESTLAGHAPDIRAAMRENEGVVQLRPAMKVGATIDDLRKAFKDGGGEGDLMRLFDPKHADALKADQTTVQELFSKGATDAPYHKNPFNRALTTLDDKPVFIHGEVARDLEVIKKLGTDPYQFVRFMGSAAPFYAYMLNTWKKLQTYAGPQFIAYNLRNQICDTMRMYMGGLTDGVQTWKEWGELFPRLAEYQRTGNIGVFSDIAIETPVGRINGTEAIRLADEHGLRGAGQYAADVLSGAPKQGLGAQIAQDSLIAKISPKLATTKEYVARKWENLKALQQAREDANRVAGFFSRLRAGDTAVEAGMRVERALFDYKRLSPAANLLRQTGAVPFISWQAKNIPFTIQFALEHPGQFMGIVRTMDLVAQGQLPDSQIPEWLKGKHQIPLTWNTDAQGKRNVDITTDSGVTPFSDVTELFSDPRRYVMDKLNPVMKALYLANKMAEEQDQSKYTSGDIGGQIAETIGGRPAKALQDIGALPLGRNRVLPGEFDPRTGEDKNGMTEMAKTMLLPMKTSSINLDSAKSISTNMAKKAYVSSVIKLNQAKQALNQAQARMQATSADANDAHAISPNDPDFGFVFRAAQDAQADFQRAKAQFEQVRQDTQQVDQTYRRMSLVP